MRDTYPISKISTDVMGILLVSFFNNAKNPTFTNSQINAHITNSQGRTGAYARVNIILEPSIYAYLSMKDFTPLGRTPQ